MAKRQSFTINGRPFATKESLADEIRRRMALYENTEPLDAEDTRFFLAILQMHPGAAIKIGRGVMGFYIIQNPVYPQQRTLILRRVDETTTDWSWRECLSPTPHHKKVRRAFRVLLEPEMIALKQRFFDVAAGSARCPITGEVIVFTSAHVDHIPPQTFEALFTDFICEEQLDLATVQLSSEGKDNNYQDTLTDEALASRWLDFHGQYAKLRVISARANLSDVKRMG